MVRSAGQNGNPDDDDDDSGGNGGDDDYNGGGCSCNDNDANDCDTT